MPAQQKCDECDGQGVISDETVRKCKNCNGSGSCQAGRGNRFVCTVCDGEGEVTEKKEIACIACKGTGKVAASARSASAEPKPKAKAKAKVIGREDNSDDGRVAKGAKPSSAKGRVPSAEEDDELDEEEGGGSLPRPAAKASSSRPPRKGASESGDKKPAQARTAAEIAADGAQKFFLARFGITGGGVHWRTEEGLEIDVMLSVRCLLTSCGSLLSFIGMIMFGSENIIFQVLGGLLFIAGTFLVFKANYGWCLRMMRPLEVQGPRASM